MVLGTDVPSAKIEDQTNWGGVLRRDAKNLTTAGTRIPFGDFLAILKFGIEDIHRTTPDMKTSQEGVGREVSLGKELNRREARTMVGWEVAPKVHCMLHGKSPKMQIGTFGPHEKRM